MTARELDLTLDDDQGHSVLVDRLPEPITFYPVVLEFTERRVVWVDAESQMDAYAQLRDEPYELWTGADPIDDSASLVAVAPAKLPGDPWWTTPDPDVYRDVREIEVGPVEACPECGAAARERDHHAWRWGINHAGRCSRHRHAIDAILAYVRDAAGRTRLADPHLWFPRCSCLGPGWNATYADKDIGETDVPAVSDEVLAKLAQQHVAGRPHSKNLPLGITDSLVPADRSYSRLVTS